MTIQNLEVTNTKSYVQCNYVQFRAHLVRIVSHTTEAFHNDVNSDGDTD